MNSGIKILLRLIPFMPIVGVLCVIRAPWLDYGLHNTATFISSAIVQVVGFTILGAYIISLIIA